ncbi:MAG: P-II family nitrogen regulator [Candidatus Cloacimonadota bacterium]|nr:P-II family nitrogen regulator [Candidatus Cloacimonadota bacterium]
MKKLECIIPTKKVAPLYEALLNFDVWGVTETSVRGCGKQKGYYKEQEWVDKARKIRILPFTKLEFIVKDEIVKPLIDLILKTVGTHSMGDGKIFVCPCKDAVRISDGKRGIKAISK